MNKKMSFKARSRTTVSKSSTLAYTYVPDEIGPLLQEGESVPERALNDGIVRFNLAVQRRFWYENKLSCSFRYQNSKICTVVCDKRRPSQRFYVLSLYLTVGPV